MSWLRVSTIAAIDQGWLSAINFAISIAFIRYGAKPEYGLYVLVLTPIYLLLTVQNALLQSPFATLFPQRNTTERDSSVRFLVQAQLLFGGVAVILGFLGAVVYQATSSGGLDLPLAFAVALAIAGALAREAVRSFFYVQSDVGRAFSGDLYYGLVTISGIIILVVTNQVSAATILTITGLAGLVPFSRSPLCGSGIPWRLPGSERVAFWALGRWALIGSGVAWVNLYMYPFIAAASFGVASVAEINAARVVMMPFALALPAWSNLVRPRFSRWFAAGLTDRMRRITVVSVLFGGLAVLVYLMIVITGYPLLQWLFGPAYDGIRPLVMAWAIVYLFSTLRTMLMATLMVREQGYMAITRVSLFALAAFLPTMAIASKTNSFWLVIALAAIEALQAGLIFVSARTYWQAPDHA